MVLSAATTCPNSRAAAVNERGVADFIMHLERTEPRGRKLRENEYGATGQDGDFLRSISPINHVEKIRVPMVVVHGANDPRVNISAAAALVAELWEYNVPVEYVNVQTWWVESVESRQLEHQQPGFVSDFRPSKPRIPSSLNSYLNT